MKTITSQKLETKLKTTLLIIAGIGCITSCSEKKESTENIQEKTQTIKAETLDKKKKLKGFHTDIEEITLDNTNFRQVLYTSKYSQLVLMSLKPKEDIGEETHPVTDQFFRFEGGHGKCIIDGTEYEVKDGDAIIIPAGARHNVINTDTKEELKIYTIYSPPTHKDAIVRKSKKDAETNKEKFNGVTTEGI